MKRNDFRQFAGEVFDVPFDLGDLSLEEADSLQFEVSYGSNGGVREEHIDLGVRHRLHGGSRVFEDAFAIELNADPGILAGPGGDQSLTVANQVSDGARFTRIDVALLQVSRTQHPSKPIGVSTIGHDLCLSDSGVAEGVTEMDVETGVLKPVDEPVPVEGTFDSDRRFLPERSEELEDQGQAVRHTTTFKNTFSFLGVNDAQLRSPCVKIDSDIVFHWVTSFYFSRYNQCGIPPRRSPLFSVTSFQRTLSRSGFRPLNLDQPANKEAIAGREILIHPNSPGEGVTVAFIVDNGSPIEFLKFDGPEFVVWPGSAVE